MVSDNVLISFISAASGVVVTYITVRYRNQTLKPKAKDRIDTAFDYYERVIKSQEREIEKLQTRLDKLGE